MATREMSIWNGTTSVDTSGDVFLAPIITQITLTSASGLAMCVVLPGTASMSGDSGIEGSFRVPKDYVAGSETLLISGILDGAPSSLVIAFGIQFKEYADDAAFDQALGTQRIASASSVSQADEDIYDETIDISAESWTVGNHVHYFFFMDDSVHTYTGQFLLTELVLQYEDE